MKVLDTQGKEVGDKKLPAQFKEEVNPDIIKRAVLAIQSHNKQPYGADPEAGKKSSAELSRRRRKYRGSYGVGISRVPRKVMSRRGTRLNWVGAFAPGTVGGRRAHPPKADKIIDQKINIKEKRKAIRSALAAAMEKEIVKERGHETPDNYPFIIGNDFESLKKTKEVIASLTKLGLDKELSRSEKKTIRSGKGKTRGRKYKKTKGPLLVVADNCTLSKAAKNIAGIDIVEIKKINSELLAPGAEAGRLTLFTENSITKLEKEKLFM